MERMLKDFKPTLDIGMTGEKPTESSKGISSLLTAIPMMTRKIATVLVQNNILNSTQFVNTSAESLVQMLQLSIGFELQVTHCINYYIGSAYENVAVLCYNNIYIYNCALN